MFVPWIVGNFDEIRRRGGGWHVKLKPPLRNYLLAQTRKPHASILALTLDAKKGCPLAFLNPISVSAAETSHDDR